MNESAKFSRYVDQLGLLQAQIAELEKQEKELKAALEKRGDGAYEGSLFRATVSTSVQERLDMKAVRKFLSPQFVTAHTYASPRVVVKVVARNSEELKQAA